MSLFSTSLSECPNKSDTKYTKRSLACDSFIVRETTVIVSVFLTSDAADVFVPHGGSTWSSHLGTNPLQKKYGALSTLSQSLSLRSLRLSFSLSLHALYFATLHLLFSSLLMVRCLRWRGDPRLCICLGGCIGVGGWSALGTHYSLTPVTRSALSQRQHHM